MQTSPLRQCVDDLDRSGQLVRVKEIVDPDLEMAEIQRRAYLAKAPALFFENVKGCPFPCVSNLFGTPERTRFIFRDTLELVKLAVKFKADPVQFMKTALRDCLKRPALYGRVPLTAMRSLPKLVSARSAAVLANKCSLTDLPPIKSWPMDGGPFITLPQVLTESPLKKGLFNTNLGMYRVQLSGNDYQKDEVGLHYQIHRSIAIHHQQAIDSGVPLDVAIHVGGHPAHTLAAVMPLPEGLSELLFAGMLAGQRFRCARMQSGQLISVDADFCIIGKVYGKETRMEGPFGDHLGYYSLQHEFPLLRVEAVYRRADAIWPFTVVGRPPQEDTTFGQLIHEITEPMVPVELPGVKGLHAVDATGVHPLLLAIGSERYVPYESLMPREILTQANSILGFNQCSLAKYLMIVAPVHQHQLDIHDIPGFLKYHLERIDLRRDLHFQTQTTMDTLDYSGTALNQGSKLVMAAAGPRLRNLAADLPQDFKMPNEFDSPRFALPGILCVTSPPFKDQEASGLEAQGLCLSMEGLGLSEIILIVLVDDSEFASRTINNFLWTTFTKSNPAYDCYGVRSFTEHKHWGCLGPLIIDARQKPQHAPPLEDDPQIVKRVDDLCGKGKSLHGVI